MPLWKWVHSQLYYETLFFFFLENSRWLWNISWDFLILDHFDHRDAGSKDEKGQVTEPLIFKQWLWILEISGSNLLIVPIHWSGFPLPDFIIILVQLTVFSPNSTFTFSCFVFFIIMVITTWVSVWYQSYLVKHVKKVSMDN